MEETSRPQPTTKKRRKPKLRLSTIIFAVIAILLAGTAFYFYREYKQVKDDPGIVTREENSRLVEKVSQLYELPDEEPAIATVIDKEQLGDQPFFANAENEDKILIFTQAKLAIIYREPQNKIIAVGPISINKEDSKKEKSTNTSVETDNSVGF